MSYFKPLRRNIGLLSLFVASVLTAGWLRSMAIQDTFSIHFGASTHFRLVTNSGHLILATIAIAGERPIRISHWTSQKVVPGEWGLFFDIPGTLGAGWADFISNDFCSSGTDTMGAHHFQFSIKWRQFPYWSIVLPLTVVSAWLLLSNRRIQA